MSQLHGAERQLRDHELRLRDLEKKMSDNEVKPGSIDAAKAYTDQRQRDMVDYVNHSFDDLAERLRAVRVNQGERIEALAARVEELGKNLGEVIYTHGERIAKLEERGAFLEERFRALASLHVENRGLASVQAGQGDARVDLCPVVPVTVEPDDGREPAQHDSVLREVSLEIDRQQVLKKEGHFEFTCSDPRPSLEKLPILVEEVGEVARAILEGTNLREELVQVASVAVGWVRALDKEPAQPPPDSTETAPIAIEVGQVWEWNKTREMDRVIGVDAIWVNLSRVSTGARLEVSRSFLLENATLVEPAPKTEQVPAVYQCTAYNADGQCAQPWNHTGEHIFPPVQHPHWAANVPKPPSDKALAWAAEDLDISGGASEEHRAVVSWLRAVAAAMGSKDKTK